MRAAGEDNVGEKEGSEGRGTAAYIGGHGWLEREDRDRIRTISVDESRHDQTGEDM